MAPKVDQGITYLWESSTRCIDLWDCFRITERYRVWSNAHDFSILFMFFLKYQMRTLCCNPLDALEVGKPGKEGSGYVSEAIPCSP